MADSNPVTGQAIIDYELAVPDSPPIKLGTGLVNHDQSSLHETVDGICQYVHRLRTLNTDFVDKLIKRSMATGTPLLRCRLGVGVPDSMYWLPWQEHIITDYRASLESINEQSGHLCQITTQDRMYLTTRGTQVVARRGTISSIVADIAAENGFDQTVIEDSPGKGVYVQSYQTDLNFIKRRLVLRARNSNNRGNYVFFVRDNTFHFHSPDYQADLHKLAYYQAPSATLVQMDKSQAMLDNGSAGAQAITYDPYTGNTRVIVSNPEQALKLSDSIYDVSTIPGIQRSIQYHLGINFPQEAEAICQNTYEKARLATYSLKLEVDRFISIRHGDFINIMVTPATSKASPWSGLYYVAGLTHAVQKGTVKSEYRLTRGEITKSLSNFTQVNDGSMLVVNELEAQGQELNISELRSSNKTKGAGNISVNGRLFADVQDPNAAPQ